MAVSNLQAYKLAVIAGFDIGEVYVADYIVVAAAAAQVALVEVIEKFRLDGFGSFLDSLAEYEYYGYEDSQSA